MNQAHLNKIRYYHKLELIFIFVEEFLDVIALRLGPDGGSNGVTLLEEGIDDMDGGETVRAGDKDFTSWSDGRHVVLRLGMRFGL